MRNSCVLCPQFSLDTIGCWIGDRYLSLRIVAEYLWIWVAAFLSLLLYPAIFLRLRGNVLVDPQDWTRISFHLHRRLPEDNFASISTSFVHLPLPPSPLARGIYQGLRGTSISAPVLQQDSSPLPDTRDLARSDQAKQAIAMLGYPLCYITLVLPLSIARWMTFLGQHVSFKVSATALFLYGLSGAVNVALFMYTRPNLLLFVRRKTAAGRVGRSTVGSGEGPGRGSTGTERGFMAGRGLGHGDPLTPSRPDTPFSSASPLNKICSRDTIGCGSSKDNPEAQVEPSYPTKSHVYHNASRSSGPLTRQLTLPEEPIVEIDATGKIIPRRASEPVPLPPALLRERGGAGWDAMHPSADFGPPLDSLSFGQTSQPATMKHDNYVLDREGVSLENVCDTASFEASSKDDGGTDSEEEAVVAQTQLRGWRKPLNGDHG